MASSKIPLAAKVGGAVGDKLISEIWHHHFSDLLNSVHNTDSKSFESEDIDDTEISASYVR